MTWDNGDRTVLVNPELGGVTFGWNLTSTAADELFAAIEGTAFHTRVILERMGEHGTLVRRLINGGGIPQKNDVLNQVYANVLNKPILVPQGDVTSLGSAIFAFMAAKTFPSIDAAQEALCPPHRVFTPDPATVALYDKLYALYKRLYYALGSKNSSAVTDRRRAAGASANRRPGEASAVNLQTLREEVLEANQELVRQNLVVFTFGNASGIDPASGMIVIKPSGVPYATVKPGDLVVVDLDGKLVEGALRPSSDLPTHLALYRASAASTEWFILTRAMPPLGPKRGADIPCLGTTHADYFPGPVPVTPHMKPA